MIWSKSGQPCCKRTPLANLGLLRHIVTSNVTIPQLQLILRDARIKPVVNQMELHPHFQQPELFELVRAHGIEPVGQPCGPGNRHPGHA